MIERMKEWWDGERRLARQIEVIDSEPLPAGELSRVKEKIWRRILSRLGRGDWISGIASDGG